MCGCSLVYSFCAEQLLTWFLSSKWDHWAIETILTNRVRLAKSASIAKHARGLHISDVAKTLGADLADPGFFPEHGGMGSVLGVQLAAQRLDVKLDGDFLKFQFAGKFLVRQTPTQPLEHLHFTRCEQF